MSVGRRTGSYDRILTVPLLFVSGIFIPLVEMVPWARAYLSHLA